MNVVTQPSLFGKLALLYLLVMIECSSLRFHLGAVSDVVRLSLTDNLGKIFSLHWLEVNPHVGLSL